MHFKSKVEKYLERINHEIKFKQNKLDDLKGETFDIKGN